MIACAKHTRYEADYHCPRCQAGFCRACAKSKQFGASKMIVCPTCGERLTDLDPMRPAIPFWYRVPQVLFFPLQGDGWMMLLGWAIFAAVTKTLGAMPARASLLFYVIYNGLLVSYFYRVIARAEDGNSDIPDWNEYQGFGDTFLRPWLRYYASVLFVFWPMAAFFIAGWIATGTFAGGLGVLVSPAGRVFVLILGLMGLFFLPMALLVMGVFKNVLYIANPYFLGAQIAKIWKEYLLAVAMTFSLLIMYAMFFVLVQSWLAKIGLVRFLIVFPIDGVLQLYIYMVIGHLLGYLAWQTRFKLKWWPETQQEPALMVAGKRQALSWSPELRTAGIGGALAAAGAGAAAATRTAAPRPPAAAAASAGPRRPAAAAPAPALDSEAQELLTREINDGMSLIDHGRHAEAAELYDRILTDNPIHLGALRGRMLAASGLKDQAGESKYALALGAELCRSESYEQLWDFYRQARERDPNFLLRARDQISLARWLVSVNKPLEAARTLREVGVGKPDDPLAPKALYQCAEILWKSCGKPAVAKQMFEYILQRYPQSAFGDQVRAAIAALDK